MSKELTETEKGLKKTIKALVELCPAYNPLMTMIKKIRRGRGARKRSTREIAKSYPGIRKKDVMPALTELGISVGAKTSLRTIGIIDDLFSLVEGVEKMLNDEEARNVIGSATGEVPPNPVRDYVKICLESIEENKKMKKVLRIVVTERSISFEEVAEKAKEKFGIELERNEIVESARRLNNLGLLGSLSINGEYMGIKKLYRNHILDLLKT